MTPRKPAVCLFLAALALLPVPLSAIANDLRLPPQARQLADRVSPLDSYALPVAPFDAGAVPVLVFEGWTERQSWRLDGAVATTLQVLAPLRDQINAVGFDIVLDCNEQACGGFDFRFAIEVIPAPDMHVNLRDYRFLAAMRGENEALSLLVSRAGNAVYVQVIHSAPPDDDPLTVAPLGTPDPQAGIQQPAGLAATLQQYGHVVLDDLVFETGAAKLGPGPFASLEQLAAVLTANPGYNIALVGHTDSVGSLADNISLSKRRAGSVRDRMTGQYGITPARIAAEGMGYLAPVASNLTPKGREANRRVEAILLSQ